MDIITDRMFNPLKNVYLNFFRDTKFLSQSGQETSDRVRENIFSNNLLHNLVNRKTVLKLSCHLLLCISKFRLSFFVPVLSFVYPYPIQPKSNRRLQQGQL